MKKEKSNTIKTAVKISLICVKCKPIESHTPAINAQKNSSNTAVQEKKKTRVKREGVTDHRPHFVREVERS